jgi:hypothetical protein
VESQLIEVRTAKMLPIRFALIVNLIQMRPIEVICTRKSIPNKEFGNCVELQSTEGTKMKMLQSQFALIANLIQMRQNRVCPICEKGDLEEWESNPQTRLALNLNKSSREWKRSRLSHSQQQFDAGNSE